MEPSWICRLANAPGHEVQRKKGNKRGNGNKQNLLEEAHTKRKRDREEQERNENGEDNHEAASNNTLGTPTAPATPAPRPTGNTASRNARKQPKRSASDSARRATANTQAAAASPSGQSITVATPQAFTHEAEIVPRMTPNDFHPHTVAVMGPAGPQIDPADRFFGPTDGWTPSFVPTAYPSAQSETVSAFLQGPPQGFALQQTGQPQQPLSQDPSSQMLTLAGPIYGNQQSPVCGNDNQFLPHANTFGAQFNQQAISHAGIVPSMNTAPGHISPFPTSPYSSEPQTPWSAETPEFASRQDLGSEPDSQQFASAWNAHMSFWEG